MGSALILVDVINSFDFEGGDRLLRSALPAAKRIATMKERFSRRGVPVIYANDNFGLWKSDFPSLFRRVTGKTKGAAIAELLEPSKADYFILKPKHSAFYLTPLELLLNDLNVTTLIIAGFQTDMCVLITAHDAHMRNSKLCIPSNCSASEKLENHRWAVRHMKQFLKADTKPVLGMSARRSV